jgi:hypothetical protein
VVSGAVIPEHTTGPFVVLDLAALGTKRRPPIGCEEPTAPQAPSADPAIFLRARDDLDSCAAQNRKRNPITSHE